MDLTKEQLDDLWNRAIKDDAWRTIVPSEIRQLITLVKERMEKEERPQSILAVGNPFDGISFYGPFEGEEDAGEVAVEQYGRNETWWVVKLIPVRR